MLKLLPLLGLCKVLDRFLQLLVSLVSHVDYLERPECRRAASSLQSAVLILLSVRKVIEGSAALNADIVVLII